MASAAAVALVAGCFTDGDDQPARTEAKEAAARLPPDLAQRRLVFTREDGTYIARADGAGLRKVLDLEGVFEFQADVSPDGRQLLLRVDDEGPRQGTWLAGIDGRGS